MKTTPITEGRVGMGWTESEARHLDILLRDATNAIRRARTDGSLRGSRPAVTLSPLRELHRTVKALAPMLDHLDAQIRALEADPRSDSRYPRNEAGEKAVLKGAGLWGGPGGVRKGN